MKNKIRRRDFVVGFPSPGKHLGNIVLLQKVRKVCWKNFRIFFFTAFKFKWNNFFNAFLALLKMNLVL